MDSKNISDHISFSDAKMKKNSLFDSERMFYDVYCLLPGHGQKVHAHGDSDKVYYVVEGSGLFTIGGEERTLGPGNAVMAHAGEQHGVRNESGENLVLLVTMAPRPA